MFHQVQTWRAIRAMCSDSSLKEGHVYNHASNYLAVDYLTIGDLQIRLRLRLRVQVRVFQCVPGAHARLREAVTSTRSVVKIAVLTPTTRFSTNLVPRLRVHYRCKGELKG